MGRLSGKVAIITGASRSMGLVEAQLFSREGAAVVLGDVLDERGRQAAAAIEAEGGAARYEHLDVTSEADWQRVVAETLRWRTRIDILVNNAGINVREPIGSVTLADWNRVLAVNTTGPMLGMKFVAPAMREGGGGAIVNIASNAALRSSRSAPYTTSKWALRGLGKVAALEFAPWGIRVNTVCPGVVPTELNAGQPYIETTAKSTPLGRNASADEIARTVLFLASDESSFMTGADLPVDGGITVGQMR
jgi:3alpha(or 20beta)-hydroxysteroid dehydrogenase